MMVMIVHHLDHCTAVTAVI